MDHFEVILRVQLNYTDSAHVPRTSLVLWIENNRVADLEDLLRLRLVLVRLQCLQKTWQQRGAHLLELNRLRIRQRHCLVQVWLIAQVGVVFLDGHQSKRQTLDEACLGQFVSEQVGELVLRNEPADGVGRWRHEGNIVEPIADTDLLSNVTRMQDVRA